VNVALPAFAAVCRAVASCCCDQYLIPTGPTAANPQLTAAAGEWNRKTDGQTDGQTPYRYIDPDIDYAGNTYCYHYHYYYYTVHLLGSKLQKKKRKETIGHYEIN